MSWAIGLVIFTGVMYITCLVLMVCILGDFIIEGGDKLIKEWEAAKEAERSERNK